MRYTSVDLMTSMGKGKKRIEVTFYILEAGIEEWVCVDGSVPSISAITVQYLSGYDPRVGLNAENDETVFEGTSIQNL